MSRPRVVIELADGDVTCARDLAAGGIFVGSAAIATAGCSLSLNADCDLVVRGSAGELTVPARVVFLDPATGAGLELVGFDPAMKAQLAQLVSAPASAPEADDAVTEPLELLELAALGDATNPSLEPVDAGDDDRNQMAETDAAGADAADGTGGVGGAGGPDGTGDAGGPDGTGGAGGPDGTGGADGPDGTGGADAEAGEKKAKLALNMHERLRGMTLAQQIKTANSADPNTRMTLERLYGKSVWEALLRNPRLTAPEVARLARMGTMPRTLIEMIVGNGAWLQIAEVRRALLTNPRLGVDQIMRVLRMLPKHELKVAASLSAYPHAVRDCAKRILKDA